MISPAEIWDFIRHRPNVPRTLVEIPADHILSPFAGPTPILPEKHYFGIVVDELFLASSRRWGTEYEPMVLAITEFTHAGKPASLPFIVGPKLLGNIPNTQTAAAPEGMLYRQIRVAGIHPFRGGTVVSTVVLCQLRRQDHLRDLLKVVENVAGAVPFGAELGTYTRLADTLLDGIGTLLGNQDTEPLVGIRQDFDHDLGTPIRNAYFALIDGPESRYPRERLWVEERQLRVGPSRERLRPSSRRQLCPVPASAAPPRSATSPSSRRTPKPTPSSASPPAPMLATGSALRPSFWSSTASSSPRLSSPATRQRSGSKTSRAKPLQLTRRRPGSRPSAPPKPGSPTTYATPSRFSNSSNSVLRDAFKMAQDKVSRSASLSGCHGRRAFADKVICNFSKWLQTCSAVADRLHDLRMRRSRVSPKVKIFGNFP